MIRNILKLRYVFVILCAAVLFAPASAMADKASVPGSNWWDVVPEDEVPAPNYDSILYSEIAPKLHEIDLASDRIKVEVAGKSAGGRDLFFVIMTSAKNIRQLNRYKRFSRTMSENPEKALTMLDNGEDFKVPLFINGSIHGNEYEGTDACIRLIETLAYQDTEEVQAILDNTIVLINVCQNPDGRVLGTRQNANYIDLNRDFISQTQPETRATVNLIRKWNPLILLDLHDDVDPMLIEPCAPPHNQNYEYDLYIKWAFYQAEAMEAELLAQTGFSAQIPYRDWDFDAAGFYWDDWPPIYTPIYAMYHGTFGHTLETPYEDERGVDADYAAVWGALKFVLENKRSMVLDQINIFWRGDNARAQKPISDELLAESQIDQFNDFTTKEFPAAYVIPAGGIMQLSTHQPAELVEYLIFNGVEVEKATESFTLDNTVYPVGTYVVWLDQPKRGLASTILDDGPDVSGLSEVQENLVFYSPPTAWSIPLLWGVHRAVMQDKMDIKTVRVKKAAAPVGSVESGPAEGYAYSPTTMAAIKATNNLVGQGATVYRTETVFEDSGRKFAPGTFIIPAESATADQLAKDYALEVFALGSLPGDAVLIKKQRIAVSSNTANGLPFSLKELGFDFDIVSGNDLNSGVLSEYDLFINSNATFPTYILTDSVLNNLKDEGIPEAVITEMENLKDQEYEREEEFLSALEETIGSDQTAEYKALILEYAITSFVSEQGRTSLKAFFEGGGDYIGMANAGVSLGVKAGLMNAVYKAEGPDCILNIDYTPENPLAAGFRWDSHALVNGLVYFTEIPEGAKVAASIDDGDFLAAGFWPGWQDSEAKGMPIIVHETVGSRDVTLMGIDPTFRGYPKNTYRIMANAIYNCLD